MTTRRVVALAVGAVLCAAAGCQGGGGTAWSPAASTPEPVPTTEATTPTVEEPGIAFPPEVVPYATMLDGEYVGIWVPVTTQDFSQVVCLLAVQQIGTSVRCDLIPGSPAYIDLNTGVGYDPCGLADIVGAVAYGYVEIADGRAAKGCPTDTVLGSHDVPVTPGDTVALGFIQCTAEPTGFSCLDTTTGAAVFATLDHWAIYNP
ncbi:MAG: hypothetical protein FWD11_07060 [Micrococcales bacterium]|nr:hypothetical protein [Micrococcales bacterium]